MKKILSVALIATMLASFFVFPANAVREDTVIQTVGLLGIMNGDTSGNLNLSKSVTRAEFAKMVIKASPQRELTSESSASAPFPDVRASHWASGYVSAAVQNGWINGYLDGRFRPENPVKMEEAVNIVLKLLGFRDTDFSGTYPTAQINKYRALGLDENVSCMQGGDMSRRDCMYLLYNALGATTKDGKIHCTTLGYSVDSDGNINTAQMLNETVKGPIIVTDGTWRNSLSFDVSNATVFRNDTESSASMIVTDDVVYYSSELRTLWVYSKKVYGVLESASPNLIAPTSVTVSGKTYSLSSEGSYALSNYGGYKIGDAVSLLLGKDGHVVGCASGAQTSSEVYGVVVASSVKSITDSNGSQSSQTMLSVLGTDGVTGEYPCENKSIAIGSVVRVAVGANVKVTVLGKKGISGKIDALASGVGTLKFAGDVQILDVCEGRGVRIYPNRLSGMTLKTSDVIFYITDSNNRITHLILDDVTGDLKQYGFITGVTESENGDMYQCVLNGNKTTLNNAIAMTHITTGGFSLVTTLDGTQKIENLKHIALGALNATSAQGGNTNYAVSDRVVVYELRDDVHYLSSLNAAMNGDFDLVGYYDKDGVIRVILAK